MNTSAREQRRFDPVAFNDQHSIIIQRGAAPVLRGSEPDGIDYLCGGCGTMTLVENVLPGKLWNLTFLCAACSGLSASPRLQPGAQLPPQTLIVPIGPIFLSGPVNVPENVSIAGAAAQARWEHETGRFSYTPHPLGTAADINQLISRVQQPLGALFTTLVQTDQKGQQATSTPPRHRHRLMELVEDGQRAAAAFRTGQYTINPISLAELNIVGNLFETWQHNPAWVDIKRSLETPTDYPHAIITLAAATLLHEHGNAVGLHTETIPGKRAADLRIVLDPRQNMMLEVKTPQALQWPATALQKNDAQNCVQNSLRKANVRSGGQLDPAHPGILLIGGHQLRQHDLDALEAATQTKLATASNQYQQIAGIMLLSLAVYIDTAIVQPNSIYLPPKTTVGSLINTRFVPNPNYTGTVQVVIPPGLLTDEEVQEITIPRSE